MLQLMILNICIAMSISYIKIYCYESLDRRVLPNKNLSYQDRIISSSLGGMLKKKEKILA